MLQIRIACHNHLVLQQRCSAKWLNMVLLGIRAGTELLIELLEGMAFSRACNHLRLKLGMGSREWWS